MTTSKKSLFAAGAGSAVALLIASAAIVHAGTKPTQPEPMGRITPWAAIKTALNKVPGRPLCANFEFDEGHWIYGVMVVSGKTIKEIEIDPMSGKVGDVETITPAGEAKEMQSELSAAISGKAPAAPKGAEKP